MDILKGTLRISNEGYLHKFYGYVHKSYLVQQAHCISQVSQRSRRSILKAPIPSAIAEVLEEFSACWQAVAPAPKKALA